MYRDITERKRAEQRLRQSEAYLGGSAEAKPNRELAWNPETGELRYWSDECYRVLGFDPAGPDTVIRRISCPRVHTTISCGTKSTSC